jgi:flagellar hook-associated protein 3 FlgL
MRVTNGVISNNFLKNLNTNMKALDKYYTQMSTGKRLTKLSDDPVGIVQSMQAKVKLYRLDQYQNNVDDAKTWISQSENAVLNLNEVVKSAYENTISAANGTMTEEDKQSTAALIKELRDEVISVGNSKMGEKYLFGGYNNTKAPFSLDSSGKVLYNGLDLSDDTNAALIAEDGQVVQYEIGYGLKADVSITGTSLMGMGEDNLYNVLDGLYNTLMNNGSSAEISAYADKLQDSQSDLMSLEAKIGGSTNRLELIANRYEEDTLNYTQMKSDVEDVDQAEVIMQYKMAEAIYQAALQVGADVIQPTLADYLR